MPYTIPSVGYGSRHTAWLVQMGHFVQPVRSRPFILVANTNRLCPWSGYPGGGNLRR